VPGNDIRDPPAEDHQSQMAVRPVKIIGCVGGGGIAIFCEDQDIATLTLLQTTKVCPPIMGHCWLPILHFQQADLAVAESALQHFSSAFKGIFIRAVTLNGAAGGQDQPSTLPGRRASKPLS